MEALRVFAREPFDDRVGGLADAGIKDLDFARLGLLRDSRAASIEDDHDVSPAPILKVAQLPNQSVACKGGALVVQAPQFRPRKDDAMTVDQKIL